MSDRVQALRKGLYSLRFYGRYGKTYKLSYPDVDEILSFLASQGLGWAEEFTELPKIPDMWQMGTPAEK